MKASLSVAKQQTMSLRLQNGANDFKWTSLGWRLERRTSKRHLLKRRLLKTPSYVVVAVVVRKKWAWNKAPVCKKLPPS